MTTQGGPARRPRVLLSAYACGPGDEPEAAAGWAFAVAAAQDHEVWVVTRPRFRPSIEQALVHRPVPGLHVDYLDLPAWVTARKRRGFDVYWYYFGWQRALARRARRLHAEVGLDLVHHVTFANDWMPCGAARVRDVPLVWGPVGGASRVPFRRLRPWLGSRGLVTEVLRVLLTGFLRRVFGDPVARRAALVVAQNDGVAERFAGARRVVVEPNAALEPASPGEPAARRASTDGRPQALFVGRLTAWKGPHLAIEVMARPELADWTLTVYGEGHERGALEARVASLGLGDRVRFVGHRPREEVLAAYDGADAFLFPSFHDQAGWVVAEASSRGCPVVCLPLGGPPILAATNAHVASLEGDVVANLAAALLEARAAGGVPHERWSRSRLPGLVRAWYADATREPT